MHNMDKTPKFAKLHEAFSAFDKAKTVILPVPYDKTSTYIKGSDKGPAALLDASSNLELYDLETETNISETGIHTAPPLVSNAPPEQMVEEVEKKVGELLAAKKFVVVIGGEHTVCVGSIKAHQKKHDNLSVLQLDAHADLKDTYEESKYNHACVMARVKECCPIVQVGIRSLDEEEKEKLEPEKVFFAKDIIDNEEWMEKVVRQLTDTVYITIDLDVFDPSIMSSTGTPEPGGLTWYPVLKLLKKVCSAKNVIGFDIVELCPRPTNKAPDFMAAKLLYKILSYVHH